MWDWRSLKRYQLGLLILLVVSLLGVSGYWLYDQSESDKTKVGYEETPAQFERNNADPKPLEPPELANKPIEVDKPISRSLSPVIQSSGSDDRHPNTLNEYTVVLGADKEIEIPGFPGELRVWIGGANFDANFPSSMTQDKTTLAAAGESARVEPFAPAFIIEPAKTQCIKIHPSGSEVRFKLIPQKSGVFDISANVYLFDSSDCSGSPVPKTVSTLKVTVEVNKNEMLAVYALEFWEISWKKILEFWAAFVALILGLLLFFLKNKFSQWFGFKGK